MGKRDRWNWLPTFFLASLFLFPGCRKNDNAVPEIFRDKPLISDETIATLEKLYSIDVTDISLFNKENRFEQFIAFDDRENLYIADGYKCRIFVFDEKGNPKYAFGKSGQGPGEFSGSIFRILVDGKELKVCYAFGQTKNFSFEGNELSQGFVSIENPLKIKIVNGRLYVLRGKVDPEFTKLDLIISLYDENYSNGRDLHAYSYPPGLKNPRFDSLFSDWLHVTERGDVYFPESVLDQYALLHFDQNGRLVKKFGRSYSAQNYSKEAEARYNILYDKRSEKREIIFPKTPPVIRLMFEDERGNVWVVLGETSEDNGRPDFENTVDIFNPKGEWLQSLKTNVVSRYVVNHKGKIYRIRIMDEEPFKQYIDVWKIKYH